MIFDLIIFSFDRYKTRKPHPSKKKIPRETSLEFSRNYVQICAEIKKFEWVLGRLFKYR